MKIAIQEIKKQFPSIQLSKVKLPEGHSLNDMLVNYDAEAILSLIDEAMPFDVTSSTDSQEVFPEDELIRSEPLSDSVKQNDALSALHVYNAQKIGFQGQAAFYFILGSLSTDMGSMALTLQVEMPSSRKLTRKLDLYEVEHVEMLCVELSEKEGLNANLIQVDLIQLSDLLTSHREKLVEVSFNRHHRVKPNITPQLEALAVKFLSEPNLIKRIDKLISQCGVIGEESTRTLLYIAASTYKTNPLHVLVQGSSGSGKSHLINIIKDCLPSEDVINLTRVTSKSFYHYQGNDLTEKLIVLQDIDSLDSEALLSFREAQSAKFLSTSTVQKDRFGNLQSHVKHVNTNFSSMAATTRAEIYFDNMSRSIVVGINESEEQTNSIVSYQNRRIADKIDTFKEQEAKEQLQQLIRTLKPYKVINSYADRIQLPVQAKMLRRLNEQFQMFILQVAYIHQNQRQQDKHKRIIATKEDIKIAVDLFFDSIMLKVDELDSSTRQFFERMKDFIKKQPSNNAYKFTQREMRQALNMSKSQCFRYFEELQKLEYISVAEGSANRGYKYHITDWKPIKEIREKIKKGLYDQINVL